METSTDTRLERLEARLRTTRLMCFALAAALFGLSALLVRDLVARPRWGVRDGTTGASAVLDVHGVTIHGADGVLATTLSESGLAVYGPDGRPQARWGVDPQTGAVVSGSPQAPD